MYKESNFIRQLKNGYFWYLYIYSSHLLTTKKHDNINSFEFPLTLDITWWPTWRGKNRTPFTNYLLFLKISLASIRWPTSYHPHIKVAWKWCVMMGVPWNKKCNIATNRWHISRVNHGVSFSLDSLPLFESQKHWLKYVFIARKESGPLQSINDVNLQQAFNESWHWC